MQAAITTANLCRRFGGRDVVRNVGLSVPAGSIYGFLGPNGAGKTTTIRMLTGLLRPSAGEITIFGHAMPTQRLVVARLMGALVETPSLYDHLTGRENLDLTRRLLGLPAASIARALDMADLAGAAAMRVGAYSLGMRQRLALARALLGKPRLLVLDEPGNGLDPDGIRDLRGMLRRLAGDAGMTIFVSSHQLPEIEQIATHVGVMAQGRLLAQGALADVLAIGPTRVEIRADRPAEAEALLRAAGYRVRREREAVVIEAASLGEASAEIVERLVNAGLRLFEIRRCEPLLEELYLHLTRPGAACPRPAPAA